MDGVRLKYIPYSGLNLKKSENKPTSLLITFPRIKFGKN